MYIQLNLRIIDILGSELYVHWKVTHLYLRGSTVKDSRDLQTYKHYVNLLRMLYELYTYCSMALLTAYLFWWNFLRINPNNIVRQHNPRNKTPDAMPTIRGTVFSSFSTSSVFPIKRLMCSFLTFYDVPTFGKHCTPIKTKISMSVQGLQTQYVSIFIKYNKKRMLHRRKRLPSNSSQRYPLNPAGHSQL